MKYNNEKITMNQAKEIISDIQNKDKKVRILGNPYNPLVLKVNVQDDIFADHVGTFEELTDAQENDLLAMADETDFGRFW